MQQRMLMRMKTNEIAIQKVNYCTCEDYYNDILKLLNIVVLGVSMKE